LTTSDTHTDKGTYEFEHLYVGWGIGSRVRDPFVSMFSEIILLVACFDQKRESMGLELFADFKEGFSVRTTNIDTTFTDELRVPCTIC